jgi:hypothetical protein
MAGGSFFGGCGRENRDTRRAWGGSNQTDARKAAEVFRAPVARKQVVGNDADAEVASDLL